MIPAKFCFSKKLGKNDVRQLLYPPISFKEANLSAPFQPGKIVQLHGRQILISNSKRQANLDGADDVLYITKNNTTLDWVSKLSGTDLKWLEIFERQKSARASAENKFRFVEEERNA